MGRIHVLREQLGQPQAADGHERGDRLASRSPSQVGHSRSAMTVSRVSRQPGVLALLVPAIDLAAEAAPLGPEVLLDLGRRPRLLDLDRYSARTAPEQHEVAVPLAHLREGTFRVDAMRGADRPEQVLVVALALDQEPRRRGPSALLAQGLLRVGHEEVRIARPAGAEAVAVGAGPDVC